MLVLFLMTVVIVALAMAGLSIGYILRGKMMQGGCGTGQHHAASDGCGGCACETPCDAHPKGD